MVKKYVYLFREGKASMRDLLGGKGANLAEMTQIGLPVPRDLQLRQRLAMGITLTGRTFLKGLGIRFGQPWPTLRLPQAKSLGIRKIPCSSQLGPEPSSLCRA